VDQRLETVCRAVRLRLRGAPAPRTHADRRAETLGRQDRRGLPCSTSVNIVTAAPPNARAGPLLQRKRRATARLWLDGTSNTARIERRPALQAGRRARIRPSPGARLAGITGVATMPRRISARSFSSLPLSIVQPFGVISANDRAKAHDVERPRPALSNACSKRAMRSGSFDPDAHVRVRRPAGAPDRDRSISPTGSASAAFHAREHLTGNGRTSG